MSQLKVDTITNEAGNGPPDFTSGLKVGGTSYPSVGPLSNRNKIINGAMTIDQRNAGAAVTANGSFVVDRFPVINTSDGAFSAQQVSEAPSGFVKSVKVTATTADATLTGAQNLNMTQVVEGFNSADLGWGTAAAQAATLSFWVRSSLTGTFGGSFRNSAANRSYPFTYSISAANTWEYKTVTVAGDTTGTWLTDNSGGITVTFGLGAGPDRSGTAGAWAAANYVSATGAVSVIGTLNATWQITGVQLEAGDTATPFEHRSFGQELALCMRYFERVGVGGAGGSTTNANAQEMGFKFQVTKRANPTVTHLGNYNLITPGINIYAVTATGIGVVSTTGLTGTLSVTPTPQGTGQALVYYSGADNIAVSAEL